MSGEPDAVIRCHECQMVLGRITRRHPPPLVERLPHVKTYLNFVRGEAGLLCPNCGAFGRVFAFERIRGIIDSAEVPDMTC